MFVCIAGKQRDIQHDWEVTRALAYNEHIHTVEKKHRMPLHKFWPLQWDRQGSTEPTVTSKEEARARMREVERLQEEMIKKGKVVGAAPQFSIPDKSN